jgi:hypothetical protein
MPVLSVMREELQRLLAEFEYSAALDWFKKHVTGKYFLKELLSQGEDQYNRTKLIEELRAIEASISGTPVPPMLSLTETKEKQSPSLSGVLWIKEMDQQPSDSPPSGGRGVKLVESAPATLDLALLDQEWKPKYKEANHWFERLEFLPTEEERKTAAFRILDLMDEVEQVWQKKDFVQKFGQVPDFADQGIEALTTAQMVTRINTLRSYISKANKGKLSKEKIPIWEAEKSELERRVRG